MQSKLEVQLKETSSTWSGSGTGDRRTKHDKKDIRRRQQELH